MNDYFEIVNSMKNDALQRGVMISARLSVSSLFLRVFVSIPLV